MSVWLPLGLSIGLLLLPALISTNLRRERRGRGSTDIPPGLKPLWWFIRGYVRVWHGLKGGEWAPLPAEGPAILIANHTCCIDHLLLQARSRRVLGFIIAREMYELPVIHRFCVLVGCIPVDRDGRDLRATRTALRVLAAGRILPVFPEGRITPAAGWELGPMQSGAAFLAVRSGAPVIPAFISGTPQTIEIGPSLWRPSRSKVVFGPPIDLSDVQPSQACNKEILARVCEQFERAFRDLQERSLGPVGKPTSAEEPAAVGPAS